jgi:predicted RNA-binding Zn-ribbon protein involved in translation (DUF1610 family)
LVLYTLSDAFDATILDSIAFTSSANQLTYSSRRIEGTHQSVHSNSSCNRVIVVARDDASFRAPQCNADTAATVSIIRDYDVIHYKHKSIRISV